MYVRAILQHHYPGHNSLDKRINKTDFFIFS